MKHRQEGRFPEVDIACGLKATATWVSANRYCQYANVSNSPEQDSKYSFSPQVSSQSPVRKG